MTGCEGCSSWLALLVVGVYTPRAVNACGIHAASQETEWIGCDGPCARWFHTSCVGGVVPSGTDDWFCPDCRTAAESDDEADVLPEGL